MQLRSIIDALESWAPTSYQESYDNAGLLTGDKNWRLQGILITLDCTEAVIAEAVEKNCNLVIAHHPIVFKGLKRLTGANYVERTIIQAIKNDIAIYAIHTNLDNVSTGVNLKISEMLGLQNLRILQPKKGTLQKLETFVPGEHLKAVLNALYVAGAGHIGNYDNCSFVSTGTGSFRPNELANPNIGERNQQELVEENRIELIFQAERQQAILAALKKAHPYEEVAYYLTTLENDNQEVGSGMIGELPQEMDGPKFLARLKEEMQTNCIRHTAIHKAKVKKIAVCGGAGSFLLKTAIKQSADVFITADFKYHEFFDADNQIIIADIGHYESEVHTKELISKYLSEKFTNIAPLLSEVYTNPINYA